MDRPLTEFDLVTFVVFVGGRQQLRMSAAQQCLRRRNRRACAREDEPNRTSSFQTLLYSVMAVLVVWIVCRLSSVSFLCHIYSWLGIRGPDYGASVRPFTRLSEQPTIGTRQSRPLSAVMSPAGPVLGETRAGSRRASNGFVSI